MTYSLEEISDELFQDATQNGQMLFSVGYGEDVQPITGADAEGLLTQARAAAGDARLIVLVESGQGSFTAGFEVQSAADLAAIIDGTPQLGSYNLLYFYAV